MRRGESLKSYAVHRASREELDRAFNLVKEYYEEVGVEVREDHGEFLDQYFGEGAGVWLAEVNGAEAGCIALRKLGTAENSGEIKRMYVRPDRRGTGVSTAILHALETRASERGWSRLALETGNLLPEAQRFYEREGYVRIPNFGHYAHSPYAVCYERVLTQPLPEGV